MKYNNKMVDLTYLKISTDEEFEAFIRKAKEFKPFSVCVLPTRIKDTNTMLGESVMICTVIGFPSGNHSIAVKVFETGIAVRDGANEIDYVVNREFILNENWYDLRREAIRIKDEANKRIVKAILETAELTTEQIIETCKALDGIVDFVKTSTGFSSKGGATIEAVQLMKASAPNCQVKASGGIRTIEDAQKMIDAGATRIGASSLNKSTNDY